MYASIDVSISTSAIDPRLDLGFRMFIYLFVVCRWYLLTQTAWSTIQNSTEFPLAGLKRSQNHPACSYVSLVMYEMNNSQCLLLRPELIIKHRSVTKATCSRPPWPLWWPNLCSLSTRLPLFRPCPAHLLPLSFPLT